jgi:hypothetical protein
MVDVLPLKTIVHFDGWNDAHRRGSRVTEELLAACSDVRIQVTEQMAN